MPRYLSQHTLACLTRQGAETLAQRMQGGGPACADRVLVNMLEGKMFAEFRCGFPRNSRSLAESRRNALRLGRADRVGIAQREAGDCRVVLRKLI